MQSEFDLFTLMLVFLIIAVHFLPTYIAHKRNHLNKNSIFLVNLLISWTVWGWFVVLIWCYSSNIDKEKLITKSDNN